MSTPQRGEEIDGYIFLGGDPSDEASWKTKEQYSPSDPAPRGLQVGDSQDGFTYLGGDPADKKSWSEERVLDEAQPGLEGRFMYKNFSNQDEAGLRSLQEKNPGIEMKFDRLGNVIARAGSGEDWRKLDPSTMELADVTDVIASDVPMGIGQSVATGMGAAAGGVATGGWGALPSAMAASGAAGGGLEAIRQGLGKAFGEIEDIDTDGVALSAKLGAISPALFGSGLGLNQAAKAAGSRKAGEELLKYSRGVPGYLWDKGAEKIAPKLGSWASGIEPDVLKMAANNLDLISAAEKDPTTYAGVLNKPRTEMISGLRGQQNRYGEDISQVNSTLTDTFGKTIPLNRPAAPMYDLMRKLEANGETQIDKDTLNWLKDALKYNFAVLPENPTSMKLGADGVMETVQNPSVIPEFLSANDAKIWREKLKEMASDGYGMNYEKSGTALGSLSKAKPADARIAIAIENTRKNLKGETLDLAEYYDSLQNGGFSAGKTGTRSSAAGAAPGMSPEDVVVEEALRGGGMRAKYNGPDQLEYNPVLGGPEELRSLPRPDRVGNQGQIGNQGLQVDVNPRSVGQYQAPETGMVASQKYQRTKEYADFEEMLRGRGSSSADDGLGASARERSPTNLRGTLDTAFNKYGDVRELQKEVQTASKDADSMAKLFTKLSNRPAYQVVAQDLQEQTGIDMRKALTQEEMLRRFVNPSDTFLSLKNAPASARAVPAAIAGGAAGWALGRENDVSSYISVPVGTLLGSKFGSPQTMRMMMKANRAARGNLIQNDAYKYGVPVWENLLKQEKDKK